MGIYVADSLARTSTPQNLNEMKIRFRRFCESFGVPLFSNVVDGLV